MSETKLTDEPEDEPESDGPYNCLSCLAGTWNDSEVCDDCIEEARLEMARLDALEAAALSRTKEG